jgi:hypothetical protein
LTLRACDTIVSEEFIELPRDLGVATDPNGGSQNAGDVCAPRLPSFMGCAIHVGKQGFRHCDGSFSVGHWYLCW